MKVDTLNINGTSSGVQSIDVPKGAIFHNAVLMPGQPVQVNFSHDDGVGREVAELRVIQNGDDYDADFGYLDKLVDSNGRVTHVVVKSSVPVHGRGPVATPHKASAPVKKP